MRIAIPLFDRFTALDAVGPYEVLSRLPGRRGHVRGRAARAVRTDTGMLAVTVDTALDDLPDARRGRRPRGPGTRAMLGPGPLHAWVRAAHATTQWTTSVCTGSLVLGGRRGCSTGSRPRPTGTRWTSWPPSASPRSTTGGSFPRARS